MTDAPTVSVIIPAYIPKSEGSALVIANLLRCIRAIVATSIPQFVEVLVQDDASPGVDTLEGVLPGLVKLERNFKNLGFAGNCNAGAARAKGQYLLFLNQDAMPLGQWYEHLLTTFATAAETGTPAGIVGPKLLFPPQMAPDGGASGLLSMQSCGGIYDAANQPVHRMIGFREDHPDANKTQEVSWITGAVHLWSREAFEAVDGFDSAFVGGYFEDVDACCRVQQKAYRVWYCPEARFLHHVGSAGGVKPEQWRANMLTFKGRWVDTKIVSPDTTTVLERFWA